MNTTRESIARYQPFANLHRVTVEPWPCEWECCTGNCTESKRECLQACAPEGGQHAEPVPTGRAGPLLGVLLVLTGWPLAAVLVALAVFVVEHLPRIPG